MPHQDCPPGAANASRRNGRYVDHPEPPGHSESISYTANPYWVLQNTGQAAHSLMPWLSWPKDGGVKMWNDLGIRSAKFVHFRTMVRFCKVLKIYWYVFNISWISCMFLYVLALLNSYYLLFAYSHELCHVRLAKAILLQRRLKALALLQCRSEAVPFGSPTGWKKSQSCPQRCPKDVPASHKCNKRFSSCSWKSPSARQLHHWWWDGHENHEVRSKTLQFLLQYAADMICSAPDRPAFTWPIGQSSPVPVPAINNRAFHQAHLQLLQTHGFAYHTKLQTFKDNYEQGEKNSFLPSNSLFTVHTDT